MLLCLLELLWKIFFLRLFWLFFFVVRCMCWNYLVRKNWLGLLSGLLKKMSFWKGRKLILKIMMLYFFILVEMFGSFIIFWNWWWIMVRCWRLLLWLMKWWFKSFSKILVGMIKVGSSIMILFWLLLNLFGVVIWMGLFIGLFVWLKEGKMWSL